MRFNRKTLRIVLLWISLFLLLRLADYSVSGAFLGDEPAQKLFNSFGMFLFWLVFIGTLFVTVAFLPYRGLGLTTMHVACGVVLVGGILSSKGAHKLLYDGRLYKGYMQINEGAASDQIYAADGKPVTNLDFELELKDFYIDRYELPKDAARWELWGGLRADDPERERPSVQIEWRTGKRLAVPYTDMELEVVSYSQREIARPAGIVVLHTREDGTVFLPAIEGKSIKLTTAKTTVTVARVFRGLQMDPKTMQLVDDPSRGYQPAAILEFAVEGQEPTQEYAFTQALNARMERQGERIFVPIDKPDMKTLVVPRMKVRLYRESMAKERDFAPSEGLTQDALPLDFMYEDTKEYVAAGEPVLAFREPAPTIKTFESKVVVKKGDRVVKRASIRVNHPLHHDGYHFYQTDYDHDGHTYTVLSVVSSRGLWLVYIGFALLFVGTAWYCWVELVAKRKKVVERESKHPRTAVE